MANDRAGDGFYGLSEEELTNAMGTRARSAAVMPAAGKQIRRSARSMNRADTGLDAGKLTGAEFARARAAGLVEPVSGSTAWRLSDKGREALRRLTTGGRRAIEPPRNGRPGLNPDESPLAWLKRRRIRDGAAMITDQQFAAGERLRADFTFAQLPPRVTASWDPALGAVSGGHRGMPGSGAEMTDNVLAASERVNRALKAVGPEFSGILVDVCCHLKGLEELERSAGWPQRSAKVVLQLALNSLARHYGIPGDDELAHASSTKPRHWGTDDFRPTIDGATKPDQPAAD